MTAREVVAQALRETWIAGDPADAVLVALREHWTDPETIERVHALPELGIAVEEADIRTVIAALFRVEEVTL